MRVFRDTEPHEIVDYNVSVALSGDFADVHLLGDNTKCLTTDATKNTVNAFAKETGEAVREPESFALALARHFVEDVPQVERARIQVEAYPWDRLTDAGGSRTRTRSPAAAPTSARPPSTYARHAAWIVSGVRDLVAAQDHRLGVPHLLHRPLHHAGARPTTGSWPAR